MSDDLCTVCGAYWGCEHHADPDRLNLQCIAVGGPSYRTLYGPHRNDGLPIDAPDDVDAGQHLMQGFIQGMQQAITSVAVALVPIADAYRQAADRAMAAVRCNLLGLSWAEAEAETVHRMQASPEPLRFGAVADTVMHELFSAQPDGPWQRLKELAERLADVVQQCQTVPASVRVQPKRRNAPRYRREALQVVLLRVAPIARAPPCPTENSADGHERRAMDDALHPG